MELNASDFNKHIGRRIALCRSLRFPHMSQAKFCNHLCFYGLSKSTSYMSTLECGTKDIRSYELQIIAWALRITVSDLLGFHSLEHLKPIPQTYPLCDSYPPPPRLKLVNGVDVFCLRTEVLHQTQEEFALTLAKHGLPISRSSVSRIESGKLNLTGYALFVIAKTLGVSCDELLS